MPDRRLLICPYCGETQPESDRCRACSGLFEPLSRQATHNSMGPWFFRDERQPHKPGCSYETMVKLIQRGRVTKFTIVRSPTTRQFWTIAKRVPGLSHFFGACYQCDASVDAEDSACHACGAPFGGLVDRNFLGLPEYRPLPWEQDRPVEPRRDYEPGEPSDWRQHRSTGGGPRGISSFATDDELLGNVPIEPAEPPRPDQPVASPERSAPNEVAAPQAAATSPATSTETLSKSAEEPWLESTSAQPAAMPAIDPVQEDTLLRVLRRTITKQQNTIRRLSVLSIALAVTAGILCFLWLDSRAAVAPVAPTGDPERAVSTIPPHDTERQTQEPALTEDANGERPAPAEAGDTTQPSNSGTVDDLAERNKLQTFDKLFEEEYREALGLIERASDVARPLADRIADLTEAVDSLEWIKRQVAATALPVEFQQRLTSARRELERLQLREFFP